MPHFSCFSLLIRFLNISLKYCTLGMLGSNIKYRALLTSDTKIQGQGHDKPSGIAAQTTEAMKQKLLFLFKKCIMI